jgi:hypothetical protein
MPIIQMDQATHGVVSGLLKTAHDELRRKIAEAEAYGADDIIEQEDRTKMSCLQGAVRAMALAEHGITEDQGQRFVTQYSVTRNYGGAEEGGWWYDDYTFMETVVVLPEPEAFEAARRSNADEKDARADAGQPDRYSVLGGADFVWIAELYPGERTTLLRPIYC